MAVALSAEKPPEERIDKSERTLACRRILTIQEHLAHSDVSTIMIYTHVLNRESGGVVSPLDRM